MITQTTNQFTINTIDPDYERILGWQDLVIRALRNPKFSPTYLSLYMSLIDTYPELLDGQRVEVEVWKVRANAGELAKNSATRFFSDLAAIQAINYETLYDKKTGARRSFVTPLTDFIYPEIWDTNGVDRKRKAREAEEKRRSQFKDPRKLLQCPECGSEDLLFDVVAHCKCGYVAAPIKDIPSNEIIIEAETIEIQDDLLDMLNDTVKLPVIPKTPVVVQESLTISPAPALGRHRRGIPCPDCGSLNHWRAIPAAGGNTIDVCAICNPDCDTW